MKKFRILGIIAIIAMVAGIAINFEDGWRSFKKGYDEGNRTYNTIPDNLYRVSLEVVPIEGVSNDSIFNQVAERKVPYQVSEITTYTPTFQVDYSCYDYKRIELHRLHHSFLFLHPIFG